MCLSSQGNLQSLFGSFKQINVAARRKQVLMTQKCNTFLWASWLEVCTLSTVLPHNDKDGRYCLGPSGRVCMMFPCQETQHWNISLTVLSCPEVGVSRHHPSGRPCDMWCWPRSHSDCDWLVVTRLSPWVCALRSGECQDSFNNNNKPTLDRSQIAFQTH